MKIIFIILFFIVFVILAIFIYYRYYFRYMLFKDMVYFTKNLKNNISFNKNNISDIIRVAENNFSNFTRYIINSKKENKFLWLKSQDINLVNEFLVSVGKGDVSFEVNNINYYESIFEENRNYSKDLLEKEGKLYLKLIIGIGLAVCIILI